VFTSVEMAFFFPCCPEDIILVGAYNIIRLEIIMFNQHYNISRGIQDYEVVDNNVDPTLYLS
jgi:hypothetical protein